MSRSSMALYTSTGTKDLIRQANDLNVGLLMCNHWRDPRRWPFFAIDNGAYSAYARGVEWKPSEFIRICDKVKALGLVPDFVVVPDIVAGGGESLKFSKAWLRTLRCLYPGWPLYIAVQDGMTPECTDWRHFDGIFVGGTMEWKLETMHQWAELAHSLRMKCHVGRIGPVQRMLLAEWSGADSIDSTTWVQRRDVFSKYINGYREESGKEVSE